MSLIESSQTESKPVRFTLAEFARMAEVGVFDDREGVSIELVEGAIIETHRWHRPLHAQIVHHVVEWAFRTIPSETGSAFCRSPLQLNPIRSVLQPVTCVVEPSNYMKRWPNESDTLLVVEVADFSLNRDLGEKALLYSRSGIADYWVVDVTNECVHVHRDPDTEKRHGYQSIKVFGKGESVSPLAFPEVSLKVEALFAE